MQPTVLEIERQQKREIAEIRQGADAYYASLNTQEVSNTASGAVMMRAIMPALTAAIAKHQAECEDAIVAPHGRRSPHLWAAGLVKPDVMAVHTLALALRSEEPYYTGEGAVIGLTSIAATLGGRLREEAEVEALRKTSGRDPLKELKRRFGSVHRRTWGRWKAKLGATKEVWSNEVCVALGAALLRQLVDVAPEHFKLENRLVAKDKTKLFLVLTEKTRELMGDVDERRALALPHYMPMTIRPLDWRYVAPAGAALPGDRYEEDAASARCVPCDKAGFCVRDGSCLDATPSHSTGPQTGHYEGGYVLHRLPLIRSQRQAHTKSLDRAVSDLDLAAINHVQATPWAINGWIYELMDHCWANNVRLGKLETGEMLPMPPRMEDAVWLAASPEERSKQKTERRRVNKHNDKRRGRFNAIVDCLAVAGKLVKEPAIYFPHVKDFRHRIYPVPVRGPNPQGYDVSKALIHFAEGKPLGETGEFWLCVRAANCAGKDKLTLQERFEWTQDNMGQISEWAMTPLTHTGWAEMAEPWQFLATCRELAMCWSSETPSEFVSHLPVPMDGSCNGIQHLSAMGLDPIGAAATNLRKGPRQDIYALIADVVSQRVERDAISATGFGADVRSIAAPWLSNVTRQTVKRAVMTTPYGVTVRGIRDQLLADGLVPENCPQGPAADYMRDCIQDALSGTVVAAKEIMGWLQDCASRLAKAGLPMRWSTPSGSVCQQAYYELAEVRLSTLCGCLRLGSETDKVTLRPSKQALASAPNVIHSFDAAHLSMTVVAGAEKGIGHWAMIHDSFGTHAANSQALAAVLREQFVRIYQDDWLQRLYEGFKASAPHVAIEPPPARGDFDITEVIGAQFFFS